MQRVTAPGLPASPALYFDSEKRQAKVSVRHATWHSREWALRVTNWLVLLIVGLLVRFLWQLFEYAPPAKILTLLLVAIIAFPIATYAIRFSLIGFLERQIFPTRTTFWFTSNAIAFKSRLYSNPVVLWRNWKSQPVKISFTLVRDGQASEYADRIPYTKKRSRDHFSRSEILTVIIKATGQGVSFDQYGQPDAQRAIPVTEVSNRVGHNFTLVYANAATLTAIESSVVEAPRTSGTDIDTV